MPGHWSYCDEDGCGPAHWPSGTRQSPIDFDSSKVERKETEDSIKFINYQRPIHGEIINNGHSVQVNPEARGEHPEIYGGGLDQVYSLVQYHFHWGHHDGEGAEHTVDGVQYAAELHLVHQGVEDPSRLAVVGVLLKKEENGGVGAVLARETEHIARLTKMKPNSSINIHDVILAEKLPKNRSSFYRYEGSLTTPPCSEIVTWTVFSEPVGITGEQLELLRQIHDSNLSPIRRNFRPVQDLNERPVFHMLTK